MLLPIRTNVVLRKTPYMNYAIIALNVILYLLTWHHVRTPYGVQGMVREWAANWQLNPAEPQLWQFITYAFLHAGFWHILGNMFFLFIFGNNVNDKLGHVGYLCFYLAGGIFAGFGHSVLHTDPIPLLGASGAVAAVTGAYLVLFPQTLITVVYWLIFIGTIDVPAIYFIGFKLIFWDNFLVRSTQNVAYDAHLAGYFFGIGSVMGLLGIGVLQRSPFDLWSMVKRWNQRRKFKGMVDEGYDPFGAPGGVKRIKVKQRELTPEQEKKLKMIEGLRDQISVSLTRGAVADAAEKYLQLQEIDDKQVLSRNAQLDVSNQLMAMGKWQECADAYEKFMEHYSSYQYAEQVELMLGVVYSRYLDKPKLAIKYLEDAKDKLRDEGQRKMCQEELDRLKG